jgi:hypothetical protein
MEGMGVSATAVLIVQLVNALSARGTAMAAVAGGWSVNSVWISVALMLA